MIELLEQFIINPDAIPMFSTGFRFHTQIPIEKPINRIKTRIRKQKFKKLGDVPEHSVKTEIILRVTRFPDRQTI